MSYETMSDPQEVLYCAFLTPLGSIQSMAHTKVNSRVNLVCLGSENGLKVLMKLTTPVLEYQNSQYL